MIYCICEHEKNIDKVSFINEEDIYSYKTEKKNLLMI